MRRDSVSSVGRVELRLPLVERLGEGDQHALAQHLPLLGARRRGVHRHGVVLAGARDAQRARLGAADTRAGHVVRVARDGAHLHHVARLERQRVERQPRRQLAIAPAAERAAREHGAAEGEGLLLPGAHDDLEARVAQADVVAELCAQPEHAGRRSHDGVACRREERHDRRRVDDRRQHDQPFASSLQRGAQAQQRRPRRHGDANLQRSSCCATCTADESSEARTSVASPSPDTVTRLPTSASTLEGSSSRVASRDPSSPAARRHANCRERIRAEHRVSKRPS